MKKYKVGDPVWYQPRGEYTPMHVARIENIEVTTRASEKYGDPVDEIPADTEHFVMDVVLVSKPNYDGKYNLRKWARSGQVVYMSDSDRSRYYDFNPNKDA